ncbi:hypothetical protein JHK85_004856 [Glycine max]|nr:hypothetical protein JHK85_004856 [Glycine max]
MMLLEKRTFGHYAKVLMDIDLTLQLRDQILVQVKGYAFFVNITDERLFNVYGCCKVIWHLEINCKTSLIPLKEGEGGEKKPEIIEQQGDNNVVVLEPSPHKEQLVAATPVESIFDHRAQNVQPEHPPGSSPVFHNQMDVVVPEGVSKDLCIVSKFWANEEGSNEENVIPLGEGDPNFEVVLSKS